MHSGYMFFFYHQVPVSYLKQEYVPWFRETTEVSLHYIYFMIN
jgi:hypothetical protein